MPAFSDHFALVSASYASYRPHYPASLFEWLASRTAMHERAWDCGTGSGQAAVALAHHFREVIATDASVAQLAQAVAAPGVSYAAMSAERCALAARSMELVTVAQALHWFDRPAFFAEVDRVLRPGGSLAIWSYGLLAIDPAVDAILDEFYRERLGRYWPSERALVESGYAGIELPYPEEVTPRISMDATWSLAQLGGYLSSWSAVGRFRKALGTDPIPDVMQKLAAVWDATETKRVRWPLVVRLGRKPL